MVVAVIDGGIDTAHAGLRPALWRNPRETPGNGRDDDNNGHVDDIHGWNFIGGRDGRKRPTRHVRGRSPAHDGTSKAAPVVSGVATCGMLSSTGGLVTARSAIQMAQQQGRCK